MAGTTHTFLFADLVGFTALSQQLSDHELATIVDRFEATAYDIIGSIRLPGSHFRTDIGLAAAEGEITI